MTSVDTSPLVDEAERERVARTGLGETLFVEAGAGTGKTHELVRRVVNLVVETGVPLSAVAAITFTEAAAAELRDRIREAFEKSLADHLCEPDREACERALADIDQAAIGTLHGFCLRILSEHALAVELPPRVEILDEVSSQLAFEERWTRFVDGIYDDPASEALVLRAWALGVEIDAQSKLKASLKDVASIFEDSWDRLDGLVATAPTGLAPVDLEPVVRAMRALREVKATNTNPKDLLLDRCAEVETMVDEVLAEADPLRQLRLLRSGEARWRSSGLGGRLNWPDVVTARAAVNAVGLAAKEVHEGVANDVLRQLSIRLAHFTRDAAEQRRAAGRLDFHDLLVLARRLLRNSPDARTTLHGRYQRLLLDEFQDTDPIQIEVAVLIAAAVEGGDVDRSWQEIAPLPGRLFFVGDPKQSIYRFRRADIKLFLGARAHFAANGPVLLRQNFRTVEPVLEWVNHAFGRLMTEHPDRQAAYQPLSAHRSASPHADHRVVLLGGAATGSAGEIRSQEAAAVARTVRSVGDDPQSWKVFDRGADDWRDPKWSDVTILLPTRTSLRQLEDALDHQRVPYRVATGSLVFDTQEVREALDAMQAIDDPGDELALVSALRSPLYACSDVDLLTYHQAGGRWDLGPRAAGVPTDHPVARALEHLQSLAALRWWNEPSALLDRLLRERDAFALAFGSRRPREVWRRLRFIVDQARAFEESGGGGLRAFLRWADLQRTEGTRVHEPLLAELDDDAVNILTIHGAKGLEFPITVLSGATTQATTGRRGPQVIWGGSVPEVKLSRQTTDNFNRLADIEAEMDVDERLRLLYVACTRARDHLVVSTFHKPRTKPRPGSFGDSYGEWLTNASIGAADTLWRRLPEAEESDTEVPEEAATPAAAGAATAGPAPLLQDRDEWLARREAMLEPQRRPRFVSATTIAGDAGASPRAAAEADPLEVAEVTDDAQHNDTAGAADAARREIPWRRGRAGSAIGRAVHAVLQMVGDPADDGRIGELASQQAHVEAVPDAVDTIAALARSALRSPSVVAAHAAERCWREVYVAAPLGDRAIEGYIDLLYETPDGLVLVDYKTDAIAGEAEVDAKVERYRLQAAAYAVALEASTGLVVAEAKLVFCTRTGAIERQVPDLPGGKAQVRELVA
ncbi:MAG: ATP-dependent helicase/nuclease AddAB, subunit A [uncultured Acidimicrobiales bacterium]|uniref:DNA 3'-5' helicase n=1 Tax=uncultured Acidimicrobiales bacterium TaxID=310071 RepID=A0A6J4ITA8_9ACTN|nr:MAG: ATP-dependent helicase/nuclease AddAB, subunit A [uncultured Acidimicrobiales bacterium]